MTAEDALEKLDAGADLVQLYTGFIYEGPSLIAQINKKLLASSHVRPVVRSRSKSTALEDVVSRSGSGGLSVAGVRITSPDRVLWPEQGVTKGELFAYYTAVADAMLPQLVDRPLTLVRCPSGAESKCFYQKHANDQVPDIIPRVAVEERDGTEPYMVVDGLPSLIALVQLGVLEFHVWGSRRDRLD